MTSDLHFLEIAELAERLRTRALSPVEVTRAQLDRIAALDGALGSYAFVMADEAMAAARAAEEEIAAGRHRGPLHGIPIGVKDLFWTRGIPTAAGTSIHRGFRPDEDATVVERLRQAGAVLLGKLEMSEGAYSDHHPSIAPPRNPWNADYWTGISSSGPAAATAAGLCYAALGSDTGGSIRWPCAANGLTGLKPTWGRVSRFGVVELAASLDHVGPMARCAADVSALFAAIAGGDPRDPTSLPLPGPDAVVEADLRELRVGVDPRWNDTDVDSAVQAVTSDAMGVFRALGATIVEIEVPDTRQAVVDWAPACAVEAAVAHDATYPTRKGEYGPVLASRLDTGRNLSGLDFQKILLRRMDLRGRFARMFQGVDVLLTPVQPFSPLSLATLRTLGDQPELVVKLQRYTAPFNLTGSPTITLPGGVDRSRLPIGFQLVGRHLGEADLIGAGLAFQRATSWHRRHPAV